MNLMRKLKVKPDSVLYYMVSQPSPRTPDVSHFSFNPELAHLIQIVNTQNEFL